MITIGEVSDKDRGAVRAVNEKAFGQPAEAKIVDRLHENCSDLLSLVAFEDEEIVGHVLFSPAKIKYCNAIVEGMALAPLAVLPAFQRQGIGARLIKQGIEMLRRRGCLFIIVLGHPEYYPKFGFERASLHGIVCQWDEVPDEAFMILVLQPQAMQGISGIARYRDEFDQVMQEEA